MTLTPATPQLEQILMNLAPVVWGDMTCPSHMRLSVFCSRKRARFESEVTLELQVRDHSFLFPRDHQGHVQECVTRHGIRAVGRHVIPERLQAIDEEQSARAALLACAGEMAHLIWEVDPRIGMWANPNQDIEWLPRCPMFDGPHGFQVPSPKGSTCPFCQATFTYHRWAVWGGGPLTWVHADCWLKVYW